MTFMIAVIWTFTVILGIVWVIRNPIVTIITFILKLTAPGLGPSKAYINISEGIALLFVVNLSALYSHFIVPSQFNNINPVWPDVAGILAYLAAVPTSYFISLHEMAYLIYPPEMMNEGFKVAKRTKISLIIIAPAGLLIYILILIMVSSLRTESLLLYKPILSLLNFVMSSWIRWLFPLVGIYYLISTVRGFLDSHRRKSSWELLFRLK